ncbi:sugar ABC transporter permease [Streptomyces sp. BPTC-684]|uniref:carbohydrate ABC transporter permease n=1 Tax=Streptomyces sp. BPTC-684 TaxID=3043734 RepID=UPI0024B06CD5|nr:sugar ABC transporter permease [Streptomyces sp. BPTC-684]WHM40745.1 sugar ABC transporter permease [Streptomyces sp. BPTC-684]
MASAHTATTSPDARRTARRSRRYRWDLKATPYAYVAPFFVLFGAFGLYPLLYTAWLSLHDVQLVDLNAPTWTGFAHYSELLTSPQFWKALRNTFSLGLISAVPQLLMALGLAHLLNYRLRGALIWRVASLVPYATSIGAAALFFQFAFSRDFGLTNWALEGLGLGRVDWESGTLSSQLAVSAIVIWRWTGYNALLYLAAMQAIPQERYEAAALDGASRWQQFLNVTIPGIRPTIVFTIVISTIGSIQLFGEPLIFGGGSQAVGGGANGQYQTLGLLLYQTGWANGNAGRASALAWLMFLLIVVIALVQAVVSRRARKG